jgi:hypothetical protein
MTEKYQKSATRAPINEPGLPHPPPELLSPFRQHPNPLISKQIKINQGNSRIFKAKNNGVSYDHRLLLPISLNRNLPLGSFTQCSRCHCAIRAHSQSFAPIRAYSRLFAPIRTYSRLFLEGFDTGPMNRSSIRPCSLTY